MTRGESTGRKPTVTPDRGKRRRGPPNAAADAVEPTAHGEPAASTGAKVPRIHGPPAPKYRRRPIRADGNALALSIAEFARLHGISTDFFFKMRREGWGPTTMRVGTRTLISVEAAEAWRRERETAVTSTESAAAFPAEGAR